MTPKQLFFLPWCYTSPFSELHPSPTRSTAVRILSGPLWPTTIHSVGALSTKLNTLTTPTPLEKPSGENEASIDDDIFLIIRTFAENRACLLNANFLKIFNNSELFYQKIQCGKNLGQLRVVHPGNFGWIRIGEGANLNPTFFERKPRGKRLTNQLQVLVKLFPVATHYRPIQTSLYSQTDLITLLSPHGVPSAAGISAVLQFPLPPGTSHQSFTQICYNPRINAKISMGGKFLLFIGELLLYLPDSKTCEER